MKKLAQLTLLVALISISGCQQAATEDTTAEEVTTQTLVFEAVELKQSSSGCAPEADTCATVSITYNRATGTPASLRDSLNKYMEERLLKLQLDFNPDADVSAPTANAAQALATSFIQNYDAYATETFKLGYPVRPWALEVSSQVLYQRSNLITLSLEQYSYMGGAHPNTYTGLQSFDASGKKLFLREMVTDTAELMVLAETELRNKFPDFADKPLAEAGLLLDSDQLPLPQNSALTGKGLLLHYNPYEIAPYVFGHIELLLSYDQLKELLKPAYKPL